MALTMRMTTRPNLGKRELLLSVGIMAPPFAEIDTTPFRESTKAVYDKLGYGDLRKQVEAALAK